MKPILTVPLSLVLMSLSSCTTTPTLTHGYGQNPDACGASLHQKYVGGPSSATSTLKIPDSSRHYGRHERTATDTPSRLNFVHSGTAVESVTDPKSTVLKVFCG